MEFRILGPLEAIGPDGPIQLGGRKQRAVLADLLLHRGSGLSADRLVFDLWGDEAPATASGTLQAYVSRLRKALGPDSIERTGDLYRLEVGEGNVDADTFEALVGQAIAAHRAGDHSGASRLAGQADRLWRGSVLGELGYDDFARSELTRLEERRAASLELRFESELALDRHAEIVGDIEAALAASPFRERVWYLLMLALYRSGRQAEALRAYQRAARSLGEELGIEPGEDLRRLEEQILLQDPSLRQRAIDLERRAAATFPTNLRETTTTFVGRDREVKEVAALVEANRLVTLLGPGGVGKTRLSVETAWLTGESFPGGIWEADLAGEYDPERALRPLAAAMGLPDRAGLGDAELVAAALPADATLILLDNCEHLRNSVSAAVGSLLETHADMTILATSRVPLGLDGEALYRVEPLAVPSGDEPGAAALKSVDSVALFEQRAAIAHQGFRVTEANARSVAGAVSRLDGMPLAVELAAARLALLTPRQLAAELERSSFPHLVGGGADRRHATLRATVDWSYDLLEPDEQELFNRLGVFAGPFSEDEAMAVCSDDALDGSSIQSLIDSLAAKSLLVGPDTLSPDARPRYRMLETLRRYAAERLDAAGTSETWRQRHVDSFTELAEAAAAELHGPDQLHWFDTLRSVRNELDVAITFASPEESVRLCRAQWLWWYLDGRLNHGIEWMRSSLERLETSDPYLEAALALLLSERGSAATAGQQPDDEAVVGLVESALTGTAGSGDESEAHVALLAGDALTAVGRYGAAEEPLHKAEAYFASHGPSWAHGWSLLRLVRVAALGRADFAEGNRLVALAIPLLEEAEDTHLLAYTSQMLTNRARLLTDFPAALEQALASQALYRELGFAQPLTEIGFYVADLLATLGRYEEAIAAAQDLSARAVRTGLPSYLAASTMIEARALVGLDRLDEAATIAKTVVRTARDQRNSQGEAAGLLALIPALLASGQAEGLVDDAARLLAMTETLPSPWFQADARVLAGEITAALGSGDAADLLEAAARMYVGLGHLHGTAEALEGLAPLAVTSAEAERAVRLLGAAAELRDACGAPAPPWLRRRTADLMSGVGRSLDGATFRSLWDEGAAATDPLEGVLGLL